MEIKIYRKFLYSRFPQKYFYQNVKNLSFSQQKLSFSQNDNFYNLTKNRHKYIHFNYLTQKTKIVIS